MPNLSRQRQHPSLVALGQAVQRLRKEREISQEGLALLSGVDRSYMGRIERGDNNVAVLTLQRVAAALELTVCELMAEAGL